jgi:transposase InsO family protein
MRLAFGVHHVLKVAQASFASTRFTRGIWTAPRVVYHINAVDIVTQWEVVATCERISEAYLLPVLKDLIDQFPFEILGFHSDNGSEYINKTVATLLEKMRVEQTKSRSRHSIDNALAESKNGSVVRKAFGYSHIPQRFAAHINVFCREHLNPYVNLHRPCLFAKEVIDAKGKIRKTYPLDMVQTPLDKLASLTAVATFLREGVSITQLQLQAKVLHLDGTGQGAFTEPSLDDALIETSSGDDVFGGHCRRLRVAMA